jgi:general stress protein 26
MHSNELTTKMWKAMSASPNLMLTLEGSAQHSEPMRAQLDKDADNCFWFYTKKTNRVASGGAAHVSFTSKDHGIFASIKGTLLEENNRQIIDKYWSNAVESWYEKGRKDTQLLMLRFELKEAEIWEADPSIKGLFKLMTGKTMKEGDMGEQAKQSFS